MIDCIPQRIWSWEFALEGKGRSAILSFSRGREKGKATVDGVPMVVVKEGVLQGLWSLKSNDKDVAVAQKSTPLRRTFQVSTSIGAVVLRPPSVLSRRFIVEQDGEILATITPDHPLTRRAKIDVTSSRLDFPTVCFLFWLVALTWRRRRYRAGS